MAESDPIAALKVLLRQQALARREAIAVGQRAAAAQVIAGRALPLTVTARTVVSGYSSRKSELDPVPLMRRFADVGAQLALPVVAGRGQPLIMRAWSFGEPLASGVWGIREPGPEAREEFPDVLIVPLLAFDRSGNRIGYGAGYYDMTIHRLRAMKSVVALGLAFAVQQFDRVPVTARDARLDLVLTEREVIDCRKA
jgi:5-formyltetrahydrofolate cyclo-ligase